MIRLKNKNTFSDLLFCFITFSLSFPLSSSLPIAPGSYPSPLSRFAFGSCNKHDHPQPLWEHIIKYEPELWLWLGDIVYADTREYPLKWVPSSIPLMTYKYDHQKHVKDYVRLMDAVNITGVWDDHDYGINNGGKDFTGKDSSKKLILNFLDEPAQSERWRREGIYASFEFGDNSKTKNGKNRKMKLIIFDTRYFRSEPHEADSDILGKKQWDWLEKELQESDAQIHFFASSVQLIPADIPLVEKWSNFEQGRTRFFSLLQKYRVSTPIILSGDVHHSELFHYSCPESSLIIDEITSSGMTHSCNTVFPSFICNAVFGTILFGKFSLGSYDGLNYGTVEIHWETDPVFIDLHVRDEFGKVVQKRRIPSRAYTGGTDALCTEEIPSYVYWKPVTWLSIILGILLILFAIFICFLCVLYKKAKTLFRFSYKKEE